MNLDFFTPEEALAAQLALKDMSKAEKLAFLVDLDKKESRHGLKKAQTDPIEFAKRVYPGFKVGPHHRKLAKIFQDVVDGKKKRVIINIAPRMGKSEFSSYLFPAYFLGNFPEKKIIMGTHTASLSEDFGRRVRNLIDGEDYHEIFPDTQVAADQKAAGKWNSFFFCKINWRIFKNGIWNSPNEMIAWISNQSSFSPIRILISGFPKK